VSRRRPSLRTSHRRDALPSLTYDVGVAPPAEHVADDALAATQAEGDLLDSGEAGARYIRGGAWLTAAYFVNLLLSLAAVPLVIRHLGPVDYGRFAAVNAIIFIVAGFTEAGLTSLGVREYANRTSGDARRLLRNLIGLRLTTTAIGVAAATAIFATAGSPAVVVIGVTVAGAGLMVKLIGDNYSVPLNARLRLGWVAATGIAYQLTLCVGYVVLVVVGAGVLPLLAVTIVASAVFVASTGALVRRQVSLVPAYDVAVWKRLLRETLPFAAAASVGVIYFRETLILMSVLSTARETGYYSAAFKIVEVLTTVPWILASSGLPILARAARDDSQRLQYAVGRLFQVGLIVGVWMSASTIVAAKLGIEVVAGRHFKSSVGVLEIQALAVVTSFVAAILGYALLSLRRYRQLLRANLLAVAVVTILAVVLVPSHGARGAAVAPTVAEACLGLAYAVSLARSDARLRLPLRFVPGLLIGLLASLGVVYALPISSELVRLLVFAGVYFPLLYVLRVIPREILGALLGRAQ
jgi:O-antigen/teichoic acid export membrane protein